MRSPVCVAAVGGAYGRAFRRIVIERRRIYLAKFPSRTRLVNPPAATGARDVRRLPSPVRHTRQQWPDDYLGLTFSPFIVRRRPAGYFPAPCLTMRINGFVVSFY